MKFTLRSVVMALSVNTLFACGATSPEKPAPQQQTNKPQNTQANQVASPSLLTPRPKANLLHYANPGFEHPIDGEVVKVRNDQGQINLADYGIAPEAALSGKQGLGVILAKGGLKLSYGIYRLQNQIDPQKKYRFEIDARLVSGDAVLFTKVEKSPWQRAPFKASDQWQSVGNTIDGEFLAKGKPIHMHIENVKGKETGVLLIDNVRLFALN